MPLSPPLSVLHFAVPGSEGVLDAVRLELTAGLAHLGHRAVFAGVQEAGGPISPLMGRVADRGVSVVRITVPPRSYREELRQLRATIDSVIPDVVPPPPRLSGRPPRRSGRAPRRSPQGGHCAWVHPWRRKNRLLERLQRLAFRRAEAVVMVSASVRDRLARAGVSPDRIHLLPSAWSPKPLRTREAVRMQMGLPDGDPIIGWVGRLTAEKGPDLFLEALAALPDRRWLAAVVGDGKERPALEARARDLGIGNRVRWLGLVPQAASLYTAFEVRVLSSRTEGTPIALFEALSAPVPVVATAVGGVPDVISPAEAILVPSGKPAAIAAGIREILVNPEAASIRSEAGLRRLMAAFAPAGWLDAHLRLYRFVSRSGSPEA